MDLPTALGVLSPDGARTILVVSDDGQVAVGLRERLPRAHVVVREVRRHESLAGWRASLPYPWMVVGDLSEAPPGLATLLSKHPALVQWSRQVPAGLPAHAVAFERFSHLPAAVQQALSVEVGGMRLAMGMGVQLPDGCHTSSAELQALVSSHPRGLDAPLRCFRSAARLLVHHRVGLRPMRAAQSGLVRLAPAAALAGTAA